MKKITFTILALCLYFMAYSQEKEEYAQEAGKVTSYEMNMTEYPSDKDADALIIYELGEYFFQDSDYGFNLNMYINKKIKILTQAGLQYANYEIPFYLGSSGIEDIYEINCTTYTYENNQLRKTKLESSNIFEEKINDRWKMKKFAMPDVKVGSVIEIRYKISTPYFFNMRTWEFQKEIPVIQSKLTYRAIPYFEYTFILKGAKQFNEFNSKVLPKKNAHYAGDSGYQEIEYHFGMKNLPAFRDNEFISSKKDYMAALDFQISKTYTRSGIPKEYISTWPKLNDELLKEDNLGKYIKSSEKEAKKILPEIDLSGKSQLQQLEVITDYVKNNYTWNSFNDKFASQKVSDLIKKKTGNSADINLFLIGLLKSANIDVNPVIMSTRNHGAISKGHPFMHFFNYVIAMVEIDGNKYYIDATDPLLDYKELPTRCINRDGLVLKPKVEEWIVTEQKNIKETERQFNITIHPNLGKMDVSAKYTASGNDGYNYRRMYEGKTENIEEHIQKRMKLTSAKNVTVEDDNDKHKPFVFSFDYDYGIENTGNKLFIQPFAGLSIAENPFKQNQRTLIIDLVYISGDKYKSTINIPEGYKVEYLPKEMKYDNRQMIINYSAKEIDGKIEVEASYQTKNNLYHPGSYLPLKIGMAEVIKHFSDMIVLVKE